MSRYYYYLVLINTITNSIIYLPKVLIQDRYNGASMAILISIPFGALLLYFFTKSLKKLNSLALPEILEYYFPRWLQISIMVIFSPGWYFSGVILLSSAVDISKLMINPDTSTFWILLLLVGLVILVIRYQSKTILFGLEIFIIGIFGVMLFIYARSIININFNWDSIIEVEKHTFTLPTLFSFAIATYSFSGSIDMASYNSAFKDKLQFKYLWVLPLIIMSIMILSFIIPIGLLGSEAVGKYAYPLITATDTLSLKTGVIDRVFIIFLVVYLLIAILNIIVHWKVSLEMIRGFFQHQLGKKKIQIWPILLTFAAFAFLIKFILNDHEIFLIGEYWLIMRIFLEVGLILIYIYAARSSDKIRTALAARSPSNE
jgi:spore germination protein KB